MKLPFDSLADSYEKARPDYPSAVIDWVVNVIGSDTKTIVDMGCGTGISTRQLTAAAGWNVVGVDPDTAMLDSAIKNSPQEITYIYGDAATFEPEISIDAITMFASLHWFSDSASMVNLK